MGIYLKNECCNELLKAFSILELDKIKNDKQLASVDIIVDCGDKFIFVEEKNFFISFLHELLGKDFKNSLNDEDELVEKLKNINQNEKKLLMYKILFEKIISIDDKIKGTFIELCDNKNIDKIRSSKFFYSYCEFNNLKTYNQFIRIMNVVLNFKKGLKIISCNKLVEKIKDYCETKNNL